MEVETQTVKSNSTPVLSRLCKKLGLSRKKKSIHVTGYDSRTVKKKERKLSGGNRGYRVRKSCVCGLIRDEAGDANGLRTSRAWSPMTIFKTGINIVV